MLIFISGGVRSGKSALAESIVSTSGCGRLVYLATMEAWDEEMRARVAKHRRDRAGKGYVTVERSRGIGAVASELQQGDAVLLDCLGTLLANEMFGGAEPGRETARQLAQRLFSEIMCLEKAASLLVVVSNEVFSDGALYERGTEEYVRALGALHCMLARAACRAVECVGGIAINHKG